MMELMRHVGRAATVVRDKAPPRRWRRTARSSTRSLGARGPKKKALGVERTAPLRGRAVAATPLSRSPERRARRARASTGPAAVAAVIDGVGFGATVTSPTPSQWTARSRRSSPRPSGRRDDRRALEGDRVRPRDFEATKVSPNIRRITQATNVTTKDIYTLFPKAPGAHRRQDRGPPKPAGCL
jgi:hypothetical protein